MPIISNSNTITCWCNYKDGGGDNNITQSHGISSVSDHGTGDFTVTYTTAMGSADYAVGGSIVGSSSDNYYSFITASGSAKATGNCRFQICHHGGTINDQGAISIIVFGDS